MNNAGVQEILGIAILAKQSGFPRIQADPEDIIEVLEQRNQLLNAIIGMCEEFRQLDLPYGSSAYRIANEAINRAKGESK